MTKNTKQQTQTKQLCLSDYGLQVQMNTGEINRLLDSLKERLGEAKFYTIAKDVYYNLDQMKPDTVFEFKKYFPEGERLETFLIVAHRYIIDHMDYEFSNDYSLIRRSDCSHIFAFLAKRKAQAEVILEEN